MTTNFSRTLHLLALFTGVGLASAGHAKALFHYECNQRDIGDSYILYINSEYNVGYTLDDEDKGPLYSERFEVGNAAPWAAKITNSLYFGTKTNGVFVQNDLIKGAESGEIEIVAKKHKLLGTPQAKQDETWSCHLLKRGQ